MMIKQILKNDWYKTATPEEMRIALMHTEQNAMNRLMNELGEKAKNVSATVFEECSSYCGWGKG